jgi:hypothetical protein
VGTWVGVGFAVGIIVGDGDGTRIVIDTGVGIAVAVGSVTAVEVGVGIAVAVGSVTAVEVGVGIGEYSGVGVSVGVSVGDRANMIGAATIVAVGARTRFGVGAVEFCRASSVAETAASIRLASTVPAMETASGGANSSASWTCPQASDRDMTISGAYRVQFHIRGVYRQQ